MSAAVTLVLLFFLSVALNEQVAEGCKCIQRHPQQYFCASDIGTSNHPTGRGVGSPEASRDMETGQEASRAAPVPGPTAERGARVAMADQGARAAMADPGARAAMAGQGTREAMAERGARAAMADQGARAAMAERGAWVAMADRGAWAAMADHGNQEASVFPLVLFSVFIFCYG